VLVGIQANTINFQSMSSGLRKKKWFQQIHMSPEDFDSFTVTAFDAKIYRIAIDSLLTLFWT
jgi:hypothetical protein